MLFIQMQHKQFIQTLHILILKMPFDLIVLVIIVLQTARAQVIVIMQVIHTMYIYNVPFLLRYYVIILGIILQVIQMAIQLH